MEDLPLLAPLLSPYLCLGRHGSRLIVMLELWLRSFLSMLVLPKFSPALIVRSDGLSLLNLCIMEYCCNCMIIWHYEGQQMVKGIVPSHRHPYPLRT